MHCLGCGYALGGLGAGPCPECGRPFDPAYPHTFGNGCLRPGRPVRLLVAAAVSVPLLCQAPVYLCFVCGWVILGRLPRPMMDDPKGIPGLDVPYAVAWTVTVSTFYGGCFPWCAAVRGAWSFAPDHRPYRAWLLRWAGIGAAAWFLAVVLFVLDPGRVTEWFAD